MVINLGGGSLDAAVITIQEQLFEVKAMYGDTLLGGIDFERRLMDFCQYEFKDKCDEVITHNYKALE